MNIQKLHWPYKAVFYILLFNIVFDFTGVFNTGRNSSMSLIRGFLIFILVILPYLFKLDYNKISKPVLLFTAYIILLFPFVSDLSYSINVSSKVFFSLLLLPIGYSFINSPEKLRILIKMQFPLYLFIVMGFLANEIFNLGGVTYSEEVDIQFGGLRDNWNIITYSLLIAPLVLFNKNIIYSKFKKYTLYVLLFILVVFLLISFKRIAILGLIFGYLVFFYNYREFKKIFSVIIILIILLLASSPLYFDVLVKQYEARSERFTSEGLEEENRYKETIIIWEEVTTFEHFAKSLFGLEAFASKGNYAGGRFGRRMLHVDYNLILSTCGIIGLLLYLNIYYRTFKQFRIISEFSNDNESRLFKSVFYALFFTSLLTSVAGQMYQPTFRSIIFLYMGSILGALNYYRTVKYSSRTNIHS